MVTLFDISTQKPLWSHFSTGVPSLDSIITLQNDGILDIQSVPANSACSAVLSSILVAHLLSVPDSIVIILQTINPFPWSLLKQHPSFDNSWIDQNRIVVYVLPTFAQLYAFFAFPPLPSEPRRELGSMLLFVTNFHETVEYYRLQMAAAHEETLLKHQVDKNRCLLEHLPKIAEEGISNIGLPPAPIVSRENPYSKIQAHINGLISKISEFSFQNSALILLVGHLDSKSKSFTKDDPIHPSSADTSFQNTDYPASQAASISRSFTKEPAAQYRQVLTPAFFGPVNTDKVSLAEGKITFRIIFYNDWFHKSPYYRSHINQTENTRRFHVSVAKVYTLDGLRNINEPVYFCYGNTSIFSKKSGVESTQKWLIDLSEPSPETESLATLIQDSITSTQLPNRDSYALLPAFERAHFPMKRPRTISISSSPPIVSNFGKYSNFGSSEDESENGRLDDQSQNEDDDSSESDMSEENPTDYNSSDSENDENSGCAQDVNINDVKTIEMNWQEQVNEQKTRRSKYVDADTDSELSEFCIVSDDKSVIEGSDVESVGTLLEEMHSDSPLEDVESDSQPDWMLRHS